jgi:hypothetical protein
LRWRCGDTETGGSPSDAWNERAAIVEFDGGDRRDRAERMALAWAQAEAGASWLGGVR